jgi:hypothetical protein
MAYGIFLLKNLTMIVIVREELFAVQLLCFRYENKTLTEAYLYTNRRLKQLRRDRW